MPSLQIKESPFLRQLVRHRTVLIIGLYALVAACSLWVAFLLRFDFKLEAQYQKLFWLHLGWVMVAKLVLMALAGQFRGLLTFFGVRDAFWIGMASFSFASLLILVIYVFNLPGLLPRGVVFIDAAVFTGSMGALRLTLRVWGEYQSNRAGTHRELVPVAVIGAGEVGAKLIEELRRKPKMGLDPVVVFDDNREKWGLKLHGVPIIGAPETLADEAKRYGIHEVLLAIPGASNARMREIVRVCHTAHLQCVAVPSMEQLATGKVAVSQLKAVAIEDLLGRESIAMDPAIVLRSLQGQVVMVTGAGGSIGGELCRQVAACLPRQLLLVDQSEPSLFQIEQELLEYFPAEMLRPLVANILDEPRLRSIFAEYRPHVIFHAAAHKHVPLMEAQPGEAIKNNAFAARLLVQMASEFGVERCILISTDKAINPTNAMGASKRMAEIYLQSWQHEQTGNTRFAAVRFGNVLGSSGSVIPIFKKQIAAGGPVKVTHPEMVRYFMTIPEAVGLVLRSGAMAAGGEIFVLDMGKPVRIMDLAKQLIELSGLTVGRDIEILVTGLRPGEKLFEELSHAGENISKTSHERIMQFNGPVAPMEEVEHHFEEMRKMLPTSDPLSLKQQMKKLIPEYTVFEGRSDETAEAETNNAAVPEAPRAPDPVAKLAPIPQHGRTLTLKLEG